MKPFEYHLAESPAGAVTLSREGGEASFLAGGTGLVDLMKEGVSLPSRLVDVSRLDTSVREEPEHWVLGAAASNTKVAHDAQVERNFPALSQAILSGASAQLRNRATVAGNLLQRTRCPYFRGQEFACNKRLPGSGCAALEGFNRNHAILGVSEKCIAAHPSDMCVALALADAEVVLEGGRALTYQGFHKAPGDTPWIETEMAPHDLIVALRVKKDPLLANSLYLKVRDRESYAFALLSVAVAARFAGDKVQQCRIALGGVGSVPWRAFRLERELEGQTFDRPAVERAVKSEMSVARPREHNAFKTVLAERAVWRALSQLRGGSDV